MKGGGTMLADLDVSKRLDEHEIFPGVFITSHIILKIFKEQLCARIRSRGRHVVNLLVECRVVVVIISSEYLFSKYCMRELGAIVRSKRKVRIIPVFLGVTLKEWNHFPNAWLEEWHQWADVSVIEKQEWLRALEELFLSRDGSYSDRNTEVIDQKLIVDVVCEVVPDKHSTVVRLTGGQAPILETVLRIQDTLEEFRSQVVICSSQSECLITKIQEVSSKILESILQSSRGVSSGKSSSSFYARSRWAKITAELDRFLCNVAAAEDLLYRCAEKDWKIAALSVFLPASCAASDSKFALVARDLDSSYHVFLYWLGGPIAYEPRSPVLSPIDAANKQDRSTILHKLESGSDHQEVLDILLRSRLQTDVSTSTPGLILDWCWIPGKLEHSYMECVASGSFKSILKCQWLGFKVAIAVYKGENAKNDLEAEASILARVQHPNVVNLYACAYDEEQEAGYLVTEFMEQDLRQLISKLARGRGGMPFSPSVSADIILQIVEAMIHLRECRVLHRDLKPANILVSAKKRIRQIEGGETYYVVKLIDFGSAKVRGADASNCHTRKQGTTVYMAPELHAKKEDCTYKWPADVYSFGMTIYEILTGKCPFEGDIKSAKVVELICAGERPSFPDYISAFWKELIEKCWHPDPEHRPDFELIRKEIMLQIGGYILEERSKSTRIGNVSESLRIEHFGSIESQFGIFSSLKSIFCCGVTRSYIVSMCSYPPVVSYAAPITEDASAASPMTLLPPSPITVSS